MVFGSIAGSSFAILLLTLGEKGADVWGSQDSAVYFKVHDIQSRAGLNLKAISAFPSTLTGMGITFTFLGLVIGVTAAGANLNTEMAKEQPNLLGMIQPLLSGAGVAFITSLVGLALSLIYSGFTHKNTARIQALVDDWNNVIRSQWPTITNTAVAALTVNKQDQHEKSLKKLIREAKDSKEKQDKLINIGQDILTVGQDQKQALSKQLDVLNNIEKTGSKVIHCVIMWEVCCKNSFQ